MFTIASEPTFTHKIEAMVPVDGGFDKQSFKATFRVVDPEMEFNFMKSEEATRFIRLAVVKLDEIADAQGAPVEWNDSVLDQVLKLPWARTALIKGYFAGVSKAAEGN